MAPNRIPTYQEYVAAMAGQNMFNPYAMPTSPAQPSVTNMLPPQQVLQANGKPSIDALKMSPNSSVLIMDTTAPIVWLCTSDSLGNVTSVAYDITQHKDQPVPSVTDFEARLVAVENNINSIVSRLGVMNDASKSDAGSTKSGKGNGFTGTARSN